MKKRKILSVLFLIVILLIVLSFVFIKKIGDNYYFTYTQKADIRFSLTESEVSDYNSLSKLKKLQELTVADSPIKDTAFLDNMSKLEKLSLISVADTERKWIDLTNISKCHNLNDILLRLTCIDSLEYFSNLSKLKDLYLIGGRNRIDFKGINNCDALETIRLESFDIPDLNGIENVSNIKSLEILYCYSDDTDVAANDTVNLNPLKKLPELESLMLVYYNYPIDISALDECQNLKYVELSNCLLINSDFEIFSRMPVLQELDIRGIRLDNSEILTKSKSLKKLVVSDGLYSSEEIEYLKEANIDVVITE